jgi:hypothetical protein
LQEAVRTGKNVMSAGKNVLKFPLVLLTLGGAPLREALEDLGVGGRLQTFMDETEGLSEFRARLGVFLYRSGHDGRYPPRGDAGNVDRLPMPSDGFIIVCTTLAVAPGRVQAYRRGHVAPMPVRTVFSTEGGGNAMLRSWEKRWWVGRWWRSDGTPTCYCCSGEWAFSLNGSYDTVQSFVVAKFVSTLNERHSFMWFCVRRQMRGGR